MANDLALDLEHWPTDSMAKVSLVHSVTVARVKEWHADGTLPTVHANELLDLIGFAKHALDISYDAMHRVEVEIGRVQSGANDYTMNLVEQLAERVG